MARLRLNNWPNSFMVIFAGTVLKLEQVGPTLSSFNLYSSVATDERKQFQCLNIVLKKQTNKQKQN